MAITKCKRCGGDVFDGAPLCPECMERHNAVYNHGSWEERTIRKQDKDSHLATIVVGLATVVLIVGVVYSFLNHGPNPVNPVRTKYFEIEEETFPQNGTIFEQSEFGFCPLKISTSSEGAFFVKVVDPKLEKVIVSVFIHPSSTVEMQIPTGNYEIRYALGGQWLGLERLFGEETIFAKTDELLDFSYDGYQYMGHTIEFKKRANGNLRTENMNEDDF